MIVNEIKTLFVNLEDPFFPIGEGWSDKYVHDLK